jgi:hypothetical protein
LAKPKTFRPQMNADERIGSISRVIGVIPRDRVIEKLPEETNSR